MNINGLIDTNAAEKKFKFDLIEYDDGQVRPNNIILHDKKGNKKIWRLSFSKNIFIYIT